MRFGEYKDALILIERYPLFGVGFTGVPDLDIYLGVSMLYLILAENMGLVGLADFCCDYGRLFHHGFPGLAPGASARCWKRSCSGYTGAILGALVSGIFDHYWFNMTYPHMTVLFWLYLGLATAMILVNKSISSAQS